MADYAPGTVTVTNIIDGCCDIYIDDTIDIHLGSTAEATKIENTAELLKVEIEQGSGPVLPILVKQDCKVTGVLAEATLANIKYLMGDGTTAGFGGNLAPPTKAFLIKTKAEGSGKTRVFKIHKGVIGVGTTIEMGKGKVHMLPFTIECFQDLSKAENKRFWELAEE